MDVKELELKFYVFNRDRQIPGLQDLFNEAIEKLYYLQQFVKDYNDELELLDNRCNELDVENEELKEELQELKDEIELLKNQV